MRRVEIFNAITNERERQDEKFPGQWEDFHCSFVADAGAGVTYAADAMVRILGEEYGEVCRAICDGDLANLRDELIQVAAVAVAFLETLP